MTGTRRAAAAAALCFALAAIARPAGAQGRLLTLDDIYDPAARIPLGTTAPGPRGGVTWIDEGHYRLAKEVAGARGQFTHVRVDAVTGAETPLFDAAALQAALAALPSVTADEAARLARQRSYTFNPAVTALLVTVGDDLHFWSFGSPRVVALSSVPGEEENAAFSPDGRQVAYTRRGNLHVAALDGRERALTTDGNAQLLNGKLDWIYQEEVFGRGAYRGFWWSPDSTRLAFLQLDETRVPEMTVVDHVPTTQVVEQTDYPRPGDPNPGVRLGIVTSTGGPVRWADLSKYESSDILIVNVSWTPEGTQTVAQVQDRDQTWLDLTLIDPSSGAPTTLLRETTRAWVSRGPDPKWLGDGTFLWPSERSGYKHLYRYRRDGTLVGAVTSGPWEARTLHGVDEAGGWVYFSGTERSPIGSDVYRVRLDGSSLTRLTQAPGSHSASFAPSFSMYVDTWSDITTPPQQRLHRSDGTEVRVVDANPVPALAGFRLSTPELLQVPTRDGFVMEAILIKPPDFDPSKRYPVYQHTYAGPQAPQVRNAWGGATYLYHQLLAQRGIVVWICDNRSASGKGAVSAWTAYKRLGESELADIEDGLAWLRKQPWVDATRIGLNGWSYGGFMTSYALTHSTSFAMGIAGGSVTDWRNYDSIYTERYMLRPEHNAEGYARTAPRLAAKDLSGHLLLVHGTMDDNVLVQNTLQFAYELQRAGKPFELMLYPKSRHGVTDPLLAKHMRQAMLDFTMRTLKPGTAPVAASDTR
jgi:dipeptidyl-peptidase-4